MIWAFYPLLLTTGPINIRLAEYNSQITYTSQFYSISVMLSRPCNDIFVLFIPFFKPLISQQWHLGSSFFSFFSYFYKSFAFFWCTIECMFPKGFDNTKSLRLPISRIILNLSRWQKFKFLLNFLKPFFQQTFFCFFLLPWIFYYLDKRFATQEVSMEFSILCRSADFLFVFVCHTGFSLQRCMTEWTIFHMTYLSCHENIQQKFSNDGVTTHKIQ